MWTSHRGGRSRALLEILALLIETMRPLLMLLPECQLSSLLVTEYSKRYGFKDLCCKFDKFVFLYAISECVCVVVVRQVCTMLPGFSPAKVLDFGAGTGSAFWALREVGPNSLEKVNLVKPSQSMQRAGQSLIQGQKNLTLIHSYATLQSMTKSINKSEREHDLVIASYVLGEIPSLKDRITVVRQLWDLTWEVLQKILLSSAGKKTVEYTVPLVEKTKDMAMFAGKTTLHYVGHVAVDLKDKATVVGWTAAHYATEAAVEGTKAAARLELKCTARRAGMELKCTAREAGGILEHDLLSV
ncbi:uncharacterized protein LOC133730897 [Rosa rugosa]|uniref:uncharacterized protein LOC133730897 n=1 Tax=Rosa rugosa TaxID=74645 RepID=UPI002B417F86|nr:uncharacterized protein LOC133730897 [Rosa rugosa]